MRLETGKKYKCLVTYDSRICGGGYISKNRIVTLDSTFISDEHHISKVRFDSGEDVPLDTFLNTFEDYAHEQSELPF